MPATKARLLQWFDEGMKLGATHMIVRCDTFDAAKGDPDCCYPTYFEGTPEGAYEASHEAGDRLMEVYDLGAPKEPQFEGQGRVFNYGYIKPELVEEG